MPTLLTTDGYKFSMAEAGWPLRAETFYYSHRRGGAQFLPVDVEAYVRSHLPVVDPADYAWLAAADYEMGGGFKAAIQQTEKLQISALPRGCWFFDREPVFSLSGPSALVSWFEPLLLMLNYRIQVATLALRDTTALAQAVASVTCDAQAEIVRETCDAVEVKAPSIRVDTDGYFKAVRAQVTELAKIVGDPARVFEVGLRAATCLEQHEIALRACKDVGVIRTSNVEGARKLGMVAVGTMGHEHVQRYGSDRAAFRAMRDRRPNRSSFLLDTFDTITSGMPAAFEIIGEEPQAGHSVRYDSGDKVTQYLAVVERGRALGAEPVHILEDGFDAELTRKFEQLRELVGVQPMRQFYGYGGYIVARTTPGGLTRDKVSAVYKLSQTGSHPCMKFGNETGLGKQSLPGKPVVFRRSSASGPISIIGQEGERPPQGYTQLSGGRNHQGAIATTVALNEAAEVTTSAATNELIRQLSANSNR